MSAINPVEKAFSGWKIWLAILIGISVASVLLFRSFQQEQYVFVGEGKGTHTWIDTDKNGEIDQKSEFHTAKNGAYQKQNLSTLLKQFKWSTSTWMWLGVACLFVVGRDFFYMIRIRLLTHGALTWKRSLWVIMLWEFASALSPGVVGGAAVAMFILSREKIALGRSTAIVIITAMLDNLFYVLMIPFVFLFIDRYMLFPQSTGGSLAVEYVFWIGFAVILGICLFLFTAVFIRPQLATRFLSLVFRLPFLKSKRGAAMQTGREIEIASAELKKERFSYWLKVFAATCGSWISRYLVINAILSAFLHLSFLDHILVLAKQLVMWLFMLISPTPGGSGVAEYAFAELLTSFTASGVLLAALAFIWRLISYFPYLFLGAYLLPRWIAQTGRRDTK